MNTLYYGSNLDILRRHVGGDTGDLVLDAFCGCCTAVAAAQKIGRQ